MLGEVLQSLHNWFCSDSDRHIGTFEITGGVLSHCDFLMPGQYYRIIGSVFNDGVWRYPTSELVDETFDGAVWAMAVPPDVIALSEEIAAYCDSEGAKASPYTSESFGGYSYTKATGENGAPLSWQEVFRSRLRKWRKL